MKELLESRPDPSSQKSRRRREPLREGVEESCGVGPVDAAVVEAQRERQVASVLNLADPSDAEDRDLERVDDRVERIHAEQALREPVVLRKIIGTLRNDRGMFVHETLLSLLSTWCQQGVIQTNNSSESLETTK